MKLVQPLGTAHSAEDRSALTGSREIFEWPNTFEVVRFARIDEGKTKDSPRPSAITGRGLLRYVSKRLRIFCRYYQQRARSS